MHVTKAMAKISLLMSVRESVLQLLLQGRVSYLFHLR